jgi:hypothetical protein
MVRVGGRLRGGHFGGAVAVAMRDPAQEFAERVAKLWYGKWYSDTRPNGTREFTELIANELRAGGWCPTWTEQQVKQIEDDTDMLLSKMKPLPTSL